MDFLERILLQRICWIYMRNPLKRPNKSGKACFCTAAGAHLGFSEDRGPNFRKGETSVKRKRGEFNSYISDNFLIMRSYKISRALSKHFSWPPFYMKDWVLWSQAITQQLPSCSWGFIWGAVKSFHASFIDLIFSFFRTLFAFVRLAWWLRLPTTTH